jgi:ATP-binding cassette subfamily F protein 3
VAIEEASLRSYVGGWAEYVRVREERSAAKTRGPEKAGTAAPKRVKPPRKPKSAKSPVSQDKLEQQIEAAEAALRTIEDELTDPAAWAGAEASARSAARHEQARRAVEELYERLERVTG